MMKKSISLFVLVVFCLAGSVAFLHLLGQGKERGWSWGMGKKFPHMGSGKREKMKNDQDEEKGRKIKEKFRQQKEGKHEKMKSERQKEGKRGPQGPCASIVKEMVDKIRKINEEYGRKMEALQRELKNELRESREEKISDIRKGEKSVEEIKAKIREFFDKKIAIAEKRLSNLSNLQKERLREIMNVRLEYVDKLYQCGQEQKAKRQQQEKQQQGGKAESDTGSE